MHNLLKDPLIRVDIDDGDIKTASLPQVYGLLMQDRVNSFPALRAHQRHAWHAWLVQVGVMALAKWDTQPPISDMTAWDIVLRSLTSRDHVDEYRWDEPWHLIQGDITKPAFMQPPASSPDLLSEYKGEAATPDALDILVTAKNFEIKMAQAVNSSFDDWIFALISLQTAAGFGGSGNYGVVRMNGGLSNRPGFSLAPSRRIGAAVRRDIEELLAARVNQNSVPSNGKGCLLWLWEWDGRKDEMLSFAQLNPLCVEASRRVRLRRADDGGNGIYAIKATSRAPRIDPGDMKGDTGDPWTPVLRSEKEIKALTVSAGGFTYRRVAEWLTNGDWHLPELCKPSAHEIQQAVHEGELARASADIDADESGMLLIGRALARGQGKTEGYYECEIPVRAALLTAMAGKGGGEDDYAPTFRDFADIAKSRVEQAGIVTRILSHAIQTFASGGKSEGGVDRRKLALPFLTDLDMLINANFFGRLQDELETPAADADARQALRREWLTQVLACARDRLTAAQQSLPVPTMQRYKAETKSTELFESRMRSKEGLPFLFAAEKEVALARKAERAAAFSGQ